MPKIKADITDSVQKNLAAIKQLLVASGGEQFNDTGRAIEYCVACTVQSINEKHAKLEEDAKASEAAKEVTSE